MKSGETLNKLNEYNEDIVRRYVDKIVVNDDDTISVFIKGGMVMEQIL